MPLQRHGSRSMVRVAPPPDPRLAGNAHVLQAGPETGAAPALDDGGPPDGQLPFSLDRRQRSTLALDVLQAAKAGDLPDAPARTPQERHRQLG